MEVSPCAEAVSRPHGGNRTIAILRLDHNPCGEEGGRSLVAALAGNALTLSLEGCAFIADAAGAGAGRGRGGAGGAGATTTTTMDKMMKGSTRGAADTSATTSNAAPITHREYSRRRDGGGDGVGGGGDDDTVAGVPPTTSGAGGKGEIGMVEHLPPPMTAAELQNLVGQLGTDRLSDFEQLRQLEMFLRPHRLTVGRYTAGRVPGFYDPRHVAPKRAPKRILQNSQPK